MKKGVFKWMNNQPGWRAIDLNINGWTILEGEKLLLLNLGTKEEPKNIKINAKLDHLVIRKAETTIQGIQIYLCLELS